MTMANTDPLLDTAQRCSVPLFLVEPLPNGRVRSLEIGAGTALLWEASTRRFLVTAAHVWTGLNDPKRKRTEQHRLALLDGAGWMLLDDATVALDEQLDVAVLSLPALDR